MNTYILFEAIRENDLAKVMTFSDFTIHHMFEAVREGKLEIMIFLHSQGCEWDVEISECAARNGHLDCLQYAHLNGCPWDKNVCIAAAENGHFDCLQYAHSNGCEWDVNVCTLAATYGHFDCLKYAHLNGCKWDESVSLAAVENETVDCFMYAISNGCPVDEVECLLILIETFQNYSRNNDYGLASKETRKNGYINCITCLIEHSNNLQALFNRRDIKFDIIADKIDLSSNAWRRISGLNLSKHPKLQSKVRQ